MHTLFEPKLVLTREPDGEYTLHAVTIAPNTCYGGGRAEAAPPPNVMLMPEVQPVVLHIKHRKGRGLHVPKPIRHCLPNLRLGEAAGRTTLTAFAMLGDAIVGSSSIDVGRLGQIEVSPGKDPPMPIDTSDWYAWDNRMPGATRSLHVTGVVTVPSPGYSARLEPAAPQGINPRDLILDLRIARRDGIWPQVVTQIPVSHEISDYDGRYGSILIRLADGSGIPIDIEEVH